VSLFSVFLFSISQVIGQTAHEEHIRKSKRGDIDSIRYMAFFHTVENRPAESFNWMKKAAMLGDARSQYGVARCYETGDGIGKNMVEAINWYRKSADQNFPLGLTALADCYKHGIGLDKNPNASKELYKKAALLGDAGGKSGLGGFLIIDEIKKKENGEPHDFSYALQLIKEASAGGDNRGHRYLGNSFLLGLGVPQDYQESINLYKKAAEAGDDKCFMELSLSSEKLNKLTDAYMWANIAAIYDKTNEASATKSRLEPFLGGRLLAEAQAASREWLARFRATE